MAAARHSPLTVGVPLLLALGAVIGAFVVGSLFLFSGKTEVVTIESILEPFDQQELATAREQATTLRKNPELGDLQQSACLFVLGCVLVLNILFW